MEIKDRLKSNSLWARCVKACSWVTLGSVSTQFIRGARLLILTYLLVPQEMHLVVLVWSVLGLLQEFTDTGIKHAIIQNPCGLEKEYANSAWLMNVVRGGILIALMYFIIPTIAEYVYDKTQLSRLLRLSCLIIAFDSLTSMSMVLMRKKLKFAAVTIITIAGHALGAVATILLTIKLKDARGVVLGEAVASLTICILSYIIIHSYRPHWCWSSLAARELIGYGSIAYLVTLIDALGNRMDVLILGKIAQDNEVAIYGLGMIAIQAPCQVFALLTVAVGFPALSMIQHDTGAMRKVIKEIVLATQMISLPLFVGLALLAPDIVKILPEKYAATGEVIRWLSIYGLSAVFLRQMTPVLYAINRVIWCAVRALMQVIIIAVLIVPLYQYKGLVGVCWTMNVALIVTDIFMWIIVLRELGWSWRHWFKDISMPGWAILAGVAAVVITYGILLLAGYEWSGYYWVRWLSCLTGMAGFGAVGVRYYRGRNNSPVKT